ncbi:MAG: sulfotransferase [Alphaproteobacteria bacterium]|nr:sulfotransferase [Alphaproteobacteria bacterium]
MTRAPAFLIGVPRSGTTLLSFLLGRHPDIDSPPEPWLLLAIESFGRIPARHPAESNLIGEGLAGFCRGLDLEAALASFAADLYARHLAASGARLLVDKTPRYYHILPFVRRLFPAGRVVLVLRDPFDVLASYKTTWGFDIRAGADDDFMRLDMALGFRRMARQIEETANDPLVTVLRYEALVADADGALLAATQAFLGVEAVVEAAKVDFAQAASTFGDSTLGDRKILATGGVHAGSVGRWRETLEPAEIQAALDLWGADLLPRLGYHDSLAQALATGAVAPDAAAVEKRVAAAEALLEARWRDTARASRDVPGLSELRAAIDLAHADPRSVLHARQIAEGLEKQLVDTHAEAAREIGRHRAMVADAEAQIATHRAMVADAQAQIATHRAMVADAQAQIERHQEMVADAERQILAHRDMLDRAGADLAALGAEVRRVNESLATLSAEAADLREDRAALKAFVDGLCRSRVVGGWMRLRGITPPALRN